LAFDSYSDTTCSDTQVKLHCYLLDIYVLMDPCCAIRVLLRWDDLKFFQTSYKLGKYIVVRKRYVIFMQTSTNFLFCLEESRQGITRDVPVLKKWSTLSSAISQVHINCKPLFQLFFHAVPMPSPLIWTLLYLWRSLKAFQGLEGIFTVHHYLEG
jgi:hypothetical protein